ncbi:MAG TPA: magnesium transporter [Candidatus Acidoferrales bacterium]|nr:magnesium transporter [Candidatus Acidoferrales bacterium]
MTTETLNEPVGNLAAKEFTALAQNLTVSGALAEIREHGAAQQIIYFYVVDAKERLVGVLPTRRLLLAAPDARLGDIMINRVVTIPETATVLEACEMFLMHKFLAFPVVTAERRIVGVINVGMFSQFTEEAMGLTERAYLEEMFERIGFHVAEVQSASPVKAFRLRMPWLAATLTGGIGCALVAGAFEATLTARIILAFFLTLVLGLSESVSAQSVAVTVEALRGREPNRTWFLRAIRKETMSAAMLGATCGVIVGVTAWLWRGHAAAALVIGGSIAVSMVVACLIGLSVPAALHRLKLDPKIAAGPVSLATADICTLLIYLNLAARAL